MTWWGILVLVVSILISLSGGISFGFWLRKPISVGTLLVITDPNDGEKYMTLEIKKKMADHIYDGNEITLTVIERVGNFPQKKQAL